MPVIPPYRFFVAFLLIALYVAIAWIYLIFLANWNCEEDIGYAVQSGAVTSCHALIAGIADCDPAGANT